MHPGQRVLTCLSRKAVPSSRATSFSRVRCVVRLVGKLCFFDNFRPHYGAFNDLCPKIFEHGSAPNYASLPFVKMIGRFVPKDWPPVDRRAKCPPQAGLPLFWSDRAKSPVFVVPFCSPGFTSQSTRNEWKRPTFWHKAAKHSDNSQGSIPKRNDPLEWF